jgi:hypothetical protein
MRKKIRVEQYPLTHIIIYARRSMMKIYKAVSLIIVLSLVLVACGPAATTVATTAPTTPPQPLSAVRSPSRSA